MMSIAENGICGIITLKNSMSIFTIIDILLGAFYLIFLIQEVILEWPIFNINGPHYFLTLFYFMRCTSLPIGIIGFIAVSQRSVLLGKCYFNLKLVELAVFPIIGLFSSYDMCKSYIYTDSCKDIFIQNAAFNSVRFAFLFYVAYISKSFYRRLERGELILVTHGKSIVELINTIQSQQRKNDIEMVAVRGVAVAEGQIIAPGGQITDLDLSD